MNVGPQDDITTFLLHIRRCAADKATSSSHDATVTSADGDKATATSAIGTGDVDTEGGASAPPADMPGHSVPQPEVCVTREVAKQFIQHNTVIHSSYMTHYFMLNMISLRISCCLYGIYRL